MGKWIQWKKKKYYKIFEEEDRTGFLLTKEELNKAINRYDKYSIDVDCVD